MSVFSDRGIRFTVNRHNTSYWHQRNTGPDMGLQCRGIIRDLFAPLLPQVSTAGGTRTGSESADRTFYKALAGASERRAQIEQQRPCPDGDIS